MRSRGHLTLEGKPIADDVTVFQGLVVKAGAADAYGRIQLLAHGLAMIAYAICDLADAVRQRDSEAAASHGER